MSDDFRFEDDDDEFGFDEEFDFGDEDEFPPGEVPDDELPDLEEREAGGINRTFVLIAAVMVILFLLGLGAVVLLALQGQGPTAIELTATAIANLNSTTVAQGFQTATQSAIDAALTQTALAVTPTPTVTPTNTLPPTVTPTASPDPTQSFLLTLTQQAALTQTALALPTKPPAATSTASIGDVAATATALAMTLQGGLQTPGTPGVGGGFPTPTPELTPAFLPETGMFEDLGGGTGGLGMIVLMAGGLMGLIFASRRLRKNAS